MRKFIIEKIKGLLFIVFAIISFASLLTYNENDPGIGISANISNISNIVGIIGAYFSSFFIIFFGYSAFLFSLFFLIHGARSFLKENKGSVSLNFFIFLIGILLLNFSAAFIDLNFSIISNFFYEIIESESFYYLDDKILYFVVFIIIGLISFFLIGISITLKLNFIFISFKYFFVTFSSVFKSLLRISIKKNNLEKKIILKNRKKQEPTIIATKKNSKQIFKTNVPNKSTSTSTSTYILPDISLLKKSIQKKLSIKEVEKNNIEMSKKLESTLAEYGVEGEVVNFKSGPVVTLFEFIPAAGVKTSKIIGLSDDIARAMSSISTRIAKQPGKTSVGIEIPNQKREGVLLGDLIDNDYFLNAEGGLLLALGKDISGEKKYTNLEKMPHLLIAGTTGSGKSVGINSMIISLLFKFTPSECKLILIDPKMLELSIYEDIPHLLTPVVTNPNKAVFALKWVVREMENRYRLMSSLNVKNISSFNSKILNAISAGRKLYREAQTGIDKETRKPIIERIEISLEKMPLIVVVIDEMADLMMVAGKEVENLIQRLAQMARASGIHIIAATQRPSVDVITGTIKANFPSRISFRVASRFDSRTILNEMGAEQLLGSGDMLFIENGSSLNRLHGGFVSENEIEDVVNHIKSQKTNEMQEDITLDKEDEDIRGLGLNFEEKNVDELYEKAVSIVLEQQKVSTSFIQRYLQIGYNRAARIVESMEEDGVISEANNSGKRHVLKKN